jgi:hypothetical protein
MEASMIHSVLTADEAKAYVTAVGPSMGRYDFTKTPHFPEGRTDVCAVIRKVSNGSTYGYDTMYLVWKDQSGRIMHREITNTKDNKNYTYIDKIEVDGNVVRVSWSTGDSYGPARNGEFKHRLE